MTDIVADEIIIVLREEENDQNDDAYIVLYWNDQEIWRELRTYEYYGRYIELGEMLKSKYSKRLVDFDIQTNGIYLYGDSISAWDKVQEFRASLK